MKIVYVLIGIMLMGAGVILFNTTSPAPPSKALSSKSKVDLTGKSSDPTSPQQVGEAPRVISANGPAPKLYLSPKPKTPVDSTPPKSGPRLRKSSGEINPKAIEYYRQAGLLGASRDALDVLKSQPELWESVEGSKGLGFSQTGGGLSITFETNDQDAINGAVVELEGGGGGARLMTIEMWMTGMEKPWDLYWEQQKPGPIAGQIPTRDQQELHYYCDTVAMDPSGALVEPSRCHFLLNMPTPEELAYKKQGGAPLPAARSRLEEF
jgi:hypothetical protein